jgi:hypothetical protein
VMALVHSRRSPNLLGIFGESVAIQSEKIKS